MGKTRTKKHSSYRYRATGLPSVKEALSEAQENANVGVNTLPLVDKVSFYFFYLQKLGKFAGYYVKYSKYSMTKFPEQNS